MSRGEVAQVRQAGYTKGGNGERAALDPLTNFQMAGTLLDFPAVPPLARA